MSETVWKDVAGQLRGRVRFGDQKPLAARLGVSDSTLSQYLDGKRTPDPIVAARLCAEVGADLNDLAGVAGRVVGSDAESLMIAIEELKSALARLQALERRK